MLGTSAVGYAKTADVQTAWRLLDYRAVDYGGAVSGGQVKSASEYAEMTEFAASVSARLATLPPTPERAKLIEGATRLQAIVAAKGPPSQVADLAHGLAGDLLKAYPVPLAPARVPTLPVERPFSPRIVRAAMAQPATVTALMQPNLRLRRLRSPTSIAPARAAPLRSLR